MTMHRSVYAFTGQASRMASRRSCNRLLQSRTAATTVSPEITQLIESLSGHNGNGKANAKATFDVINPAQPDMVLASVPVHTADDAHAAIQVAASDLASWSDETTAAARGALISKWASAMTQHTETLATLMTLESGKPLTESRGEVAYATSFLQYYAAEAVRPTGAGGGFLVPTPFADTAAKPRGHIMAVQQAVGTCAMITPWNFPAAMVSVHICIGF